MSGQGLVVSGQSLEIAGATVDGESQSPADNEGDSQESQATSEQLTTDYRPLTTDIDTARAAGTPVVAVDCDRARQLDDDRREDSARHAGTPPRNRDSGAAEKIGALVDSKFSEHPCRA